MPRVSCIEREIIATCARHRKGTRYVPQLPNFCRVNYPYYHMSGHLVSCNTDVPITIGSAVCTKSFAKPNTDDIGAPSLISIRLKSCYR